MIFYIPPYKSLLTFVSYISFFPFELSQELPVQSSCLLLLLIFLNIEVFLAFEKVIHEDSPALLSPFAFNAASHRTTYQLIEQAQICSLKIYSL